MFSARRADLSPVRAIHGTSRAYSSGAPPPCQGGTTREGSRRSVLATDSAAVMSGTPLKMGMGAHTQQDEEHDKTLGKGFCALVSFLVFFLVVIFVSAGTVEQIEDALRSEALEYRRGPVVWAVIRDDLVDGLVSMRASASRPQAPTKVVVGLAFKEAAPAGEYSWSVATECRAGAGTDLTLRHGALLNEAGPSARVIYDENLPLTGPDSVVGKQLVLTGPRGAIVCALIDFTTADGQQISSLAGGTRGATCEGDNGAVASTNYLATQAGLRILAEGGNAADAAVAVQLMLGVSQPESNGIGGGCVIVLYNATTKEVQTIDGREEAPARFHPNVFCADASCGNDPACSSCPKNETLAFGERYTGGLAVGVPGTFAAAARLNEEHGTKPLSELAAPAIKTAREGIAMTNHLYNAIRGSVGRLELWDASKELYLSRNSARAELRTDGRGGDVVGIATLTEQNATATDVAYRVQGLEPHSIHSLHIHEASDYRNGCMSAGESSTPSGLVNFRADAYGNAEGTSQIIGLIRVGGDDAVLGRAVVLHSGVGELGSSGNTDIRVMCGTLQRKPVADPGETWYNPDLAATYELLSEKGAGEFYQGALAQEIVSAVQEAVNPVSNRGGLMDYADISGYRAVKRAPTRVHFEGPKGEDYQIFGMGMPSSGGATMAMIFNLLEAAHKAGDYGPMTFRPTNGEDVPAGSNAGSAGSSGGEHEADEAVAAATNAYDSSTRASYESNWARDVNYTVQNLQALADAQNIAFADRNKYMGDADFVDLPMPNSGIDSIPDDGGLFSKQYARERWRDYGGKTQQEVPWGVPPDWDGELGPGMLEDDHGTTHFVVVDRAKNVISWTTTIESNMGSSVVVPGRGFPLNNEMTDFDATAEDSQGLPNANAPQGGKMPRRTALLPEERQLLGGKRPRSSMSPTIVLKDEEPFVAIGCPGGSSIIGAVSNALLGRLVHELPLQTAVDLPRIISKNPSNTIEAPMCVQWPQLCEEFRRDYPNTRVSAPGTLVQAIELLDNGGILSAADTKRIDSGACGAI